MTSEAVVEIHTITVNGLPKFVSDFDGLRCAIEGLRGGMKYRYGSSEIRNWVLAMMAGWCGKECYKTYRLSKFLPLVRARRFPLINGKLPCRHDLGSPKPDRTTIGYGRCNIPNKPVFYCSLYEDTALAELDAQLGETFAVATYELRESFLVFPLGEIDYFRRTGQTYIGPAQGDVVDHYREMQAKENWDGIRLLDAFLAEQFLERATSSADYRVTSAFCDILLDDFGDRGDVDAIMYPSVAFRAGLNFAVTTEAERVKLRLLPKETRIVQITEVLGFGMYKTEDLFILARETEQGGLEWDKCARQDA